MGRRGWRPFGPSPGFFPWSCPEVVSAGTGMWGVVIPCISGPSAAWAWFPPTMKVGRGCLCASEGSGARIQVRIRCSSWAMTASGHPTISSDGNRGQLDAGAWKAPGWSIGGSLPYLPMEFWLDSSSGAAIISPMGPSGTGGGGAGVSLSPLSASNRGDSSSYGEVGIIWPGTSSFGIGPVLGPPPPGEGWRGEGE
jgi:hypothetical protein